MSQWFYARAGQQRGPVPESELSRLAASGEFDPDTDLVWREGMSGWQTASSISDLSFVAPASGPPPLRPDNGLNPYAIPASGGAVAEIPPAMGDEIEPGGQPLAVGPCISRAFELTKANFGLLLLVGIVSVAISIGLNMILLAVSMIIQIMVGEFGNMVADPGNFSQTPTRHPGVIAVTVVSQIIEQVVSFFLSLGLIRIGLNLVSGQPAGLAMLFGQGSKVLRAVGAGIIYMVVVAIGLLCLVFPGIYLMIRLGQHMNAIVDKDMGVMDSLKYSWSITSNNGLPLFVLLLLSLLIVLAGFLALVVGLFFAYPLVVLAWIVAYRWMQHGSSVTRPV